MDLELARAFQAKNQTRVKEFYYRGAIAAPAASASPNGRLVVRIPYRILLVIARSILLALVIASTPWIASVLRSPDANYVAARPRPIDDMFFLPMLFGDLSDLGLLKPDDHAGYVGEAARQRLAILKEREMDVISELDVKRQRSISADTFDFIFADGFTAVEFIDHSLKTGGVVAIQMSGDPLEAFRVPSNYKIVYLQHFQANVVAIRKIGGADDGEEVVSSYKNRRLLSISDDTKKAALDSLEDVLLEPPRAASARSNRYLRKTKYLPDLTGDSLDEYPRRVFIDVGTPGKGSSSTIWFKEHYPTRNRDFDIYKVEMVTERNAAASILVSPPIGMSDWLKLNVKEEEYVVMKAESEVVEEMARSETIHLVDELFLECKHQGQKGGKHMEKSKKAYWECLALYGRLRDRGVAVHQWWD